MTAIADPRSPRVAVRRRGGSLEKWGWVYMRVSGVLLLVLIFGHLFVNLVVGDGIRAVDFAFVAGKYATPFWQIWDVAMLWLAMIHGTNGMRTIVNDYVTGPAMRILGVSVSIRQILVVALWTTAAFLILLGTLVVFTFDPCIGFGQDSSDLLQQLCAG